MKKIKEFFKTVFILLKWSVEYFATIGIILWFLFRFNVFSLHHWWKFSHATLHGFWGFTFGAIIYGAIPIYIATVLIISRKKEPIIKYSIIDFIKNILLKILKIFTPKKAEKTSTDEPTDTQSKDDEPEYPSDLPPELRVPYMRAKQNISLTGALSSFNQDSQQQTTAAESSSEPDASAFPIPSDFDISDTSTESKTAPDSIIPTFTDINFDEPIKPNFPKKNTIMKYFESKNTEYETYNDYVITRKYLVYDHDDEDFWIMDDENWFASGKQKPSPVKEMVELSKQNDLTPVIYFESENVMDFENTKKNLASNGIRIITTPDELD